MNHLVFYFDTHIPEAAAKQLRSKGVEVVRCEEIGQANVTDVEHLQYAAQHGMAMVSHDQDFLRLHQQWLTNGAKHCGIFFLHQELQGQVGAIVNALIEYVQLVEYGAATLEDDIINQVIYIR